MHNRNQGGFTLVEMMLALVIFAMLSMAGYHMLNGAVRTHDLIRSHTTRLGEIQRVMALIKNDLMSAVFVIPGRYPASGELRIRSDDSRDILSLTRYTGLYPTAQASVAPERVIWRQENQSLRRLSRPGALGTQTGPWMVTARFDLDTPVNVRFYDRGRWVAGWSSALAPQAAQITLNDSRYGEIRMLVLMGDAP